MTEQKLSFEQAVARLEEIVQALEAENKPLEEMLSEFSEGVRLLAGCRQQLTAAEAAMQQTLEFPELK